ncbi:hypothetical protein KGF56_002193 [Candida oxycetoniae]|uniref:SET domain-containing protein n=1 Tax=Candida oxycetoniae TaxID=497107 RepID=A0AAI9WYD7_9ASCO|nr:uncharacterized protein KGF56_002193 [Candida oxycetoniae]KAI3405028.2 hypothetical protein KGF56_002193 [Candida oxycetoniae]
MTTVGYNSMPHTLDSPKGPSTHREYWKQRLCNKLTQDVYIFPVDENSKKEFYDTITNDKIQVFGKELAPGNRGVQAVSDFDIGAVIMDVSAVSGYFDEPHLQGKSLRYLTYYHEILQNFVHIEDMHKIEQDILHLTLITLFNYLEDSEFACKVNNLCTHQRQIRSDHEMCQSRDKVKGKMVEIMISFFTNFPPAMALFKKGDIKVTKSNWKFFENLINLVFINYSTLMNYRYQAVGIVLDPQFSIINHSCMPNCFQVETGYESFQLINTLPIKQNEEITVTYISSGMPIELRQHQLYSRYYFRCKCQLCTMKYDIFFTMQCDSCFKPIKSPSLHGVLTTPNTIIKEISCSKCFHQLDNELYARQVQIRNFLIALILNPNSSYNSNNEGFFSLLQKEFLGLTEKYGKSVLVKILNQAIDDFFVPRERIDFVKSLIDEVMQKRVFQLCTFPFNVVVRTLLTTCEIEDFASGMEFLKYYARELFAVNFPTDLSNQLFFNECLYLDLADYIMEVIEHLRIQKIDTYFGSYHDSLELLSRCAYFFYKHVKSKFEESYVEEKLISIRNEFSPITSEYSIHTCLEKFFTHANANIYITKTRFLIFNARHEQVTLFHTFDSEDYL